MLEVKRTRITHNDRLQWISDRHKKWGWNVPFFDLDYFSFLGVEYDRAKPVALIEYKHHQERDIHKTAKAALRELSIRALVPAFIVRYNPESAIFLIEPLTDQAKSLISTEKVGWIIEYDYMKFLYEIRLREDEILDSDHE
jgi:hypothetical protein